MSATLKKLRTLGAILLAVMLSGCISFTGHFGTKIRVEHIPKIEDGATTREEIMSWFGPPSAFFNPSFLDLILGDEEEMTDTETALLNDVYSYRYIENESTLFFIPILFGIFDAVAVSETLIVFFDEEGRVEYHAYRRDVAGPGKDD
jgi:hypothetical protein